MKCRNLRVCALALLMTLALTSIASPVWVKQYDSQLDEGSTGPTSDAFRPWGEEMGGGITSWYLLTATPDANIERLSVYVQNIQGCPQCYDWAYRIKIGPTTDSQITQNPDSQVSQYTTVHPGWNPGPALTPGWNDINLTTSCLMSSSNNYIIKFEYIGDGNPTPGQDNYWLSRSDYLDHYSFAYTFGLGVGRYGYLPRLRMYSNEPDLVPTVLRVSPDVLWSDRLVHFTLDILNDSDVDVTESYDVTLDYKELADADWSQMGVPRHVHGHLASRYETVSWAWLPGTTGFYCFKVQVDDGNDVFETNELNNELPYWVRHNIKDPPSPPVKTLILADSYMMVERGYSPNDVNSLMQDIDYLADNDPRGRGLVVDIANFKNNSDLILARDKHWNAHIGDPNTKFGTNVYVDALDELIENRRHYSYPDLKHVVIVGSHEIIPMYARKDEVGKDGARENYWGGGAYDYQTDMYYLYTIPAPGNYLTDAKYADLDYLDDANEPQLTRELQVGRLVETPNQISTIIDNYFAVNATNPMDDIACIGSLDFMDGARKAAANLTDYNYTPDTSLINEDIDSTAVPGKISNKNDLIYIGGHGDYNNIATKGDGWWVGNTWHKRIDERFWAGTHATLGDTNDVNSLPTAVVVAAGCHNGALLPNKTYHEPNDNTNYHDYPEEFASKGVIAYLGATGYTWISVDDGGAGDADTMHSETLCAETVRKFAAGLTIGDAYRRAANDFYLNNKNTLNNRNRKVLGIHQLYGLPGYMRFSNVVVPPGGWHFGNTTREETGDNTVVVRTTLTIDSWIADPNGFVHIPGADNTGGPETPVLPVIRFTEPNAVPPGACLKKAHFYESLSQPYEFFNIVPTTGLGQSEAYAPAQPFTPPSTDYYPIVPCSGYVILNEGGQDAQLGLILRPVQFNHSTATTRVWETMVLEFEYDKTQFAFRDAFSTGDLASWTITQLGAAQVQLDHTSFFSTPYALKISGASAAGDRVKVQSPPINIDFTKPYRISCMFKYSSFHWDRFLIFGHVRLLLDQFDLPLLYDPVGDNSFVGNPIGPAFNSYAPPDTWMAVEVHVKPDVRQYNIRINDTHIGAVTYQQTLDPSQTLWFEDNGSAANYLNASYDDFLVMGAAPVTPSQFPGDFDGDGDADLDDFAVLATHWIRQDCTEPSWCDDTDINKSGDVDIDELTQLTQNWLEDTTP